MPVAIAETLLARVSGVSPAALDAVCLPRTAAALARADAAEQRAAVLTGPLEAALFELVPRLDGNARRAALQLKRDVHNGRTPRARVDVAGLAPWLTAVGERDAALAEADALLAGEAADAERAAVGSLRAVADGLALASPDFAAELEHLPDGARAPARTRLGRSCIAYLSRTAVKTSPFSTLTTLTLTGFERSPAPAGGRRRLLPAPALALELLDACAQHRVLAAAFRYAPADWRWGSGVLVPRHLCTDGFFHRTERVADASGYAASLRTLERIGMGSHAEYVTALGGHAAFRRLVGTRLLRPIAPWRRADEDRLGALANALRVVDYEAAERVAALARAVDAVGRPHAASRARRLAEVRRAGAEALAAFGAQPPRWLRDAAVVHEDVSAAHPLPPLPSAVHEDLERLAAHLRPRMLRTRFYDRLVAHFAARYGVGATCTDVVDFLSSFMARPDLSRVVRESMAEDAAAITRPGGPQHRAAVGPSTAVPAASVFFGLAADGPDALAAGRYRLVPSHMNPGLGALLARSATVLPTAGALREWVRTVHPQAHTVELAAAGDWSALHAGRGELPALRWPAETPTGEPEMTLAELALTHSADDGTLTLHDGDGRPVAPVYLGVAPPHMIRGPLRLLLTLADPWVAGHRFGFDRGPWDAPVVPPEAVEHEPRRRDGRLVLRRARWRVPAGEFPRARRGESELDFLRRAGRWQREHGLPDEVFMTVERQAFTLAAGRRKPTWLVWDSLHALAAAAHRIDGDPVAINLVEALPGRREHPARGADGLARAVEYVALLAWPDSEAAATEAVARVAIGAAAA